MIVKMRYAFLYASEYAIYSNWWPVGPAPQAFLETKEPVSEFTSMPQSSPNVESIHDSPEEVAPGPTPQPPPNSSSLSQPTPLSSATQIAPVPAPQTQTGSQEGFSDPTHLANASPRMNNSNSHSEAPLGSAETAEQALPDTVKPNSAPRNTPAADVHSVDSASQAGTDSHSALPNKDSEQMVSAPSAAPVTVPQITPSPQSTPLEAPPVSPGSIQPDKGSNGLATAKPGESAAETMPSTEILRPLVEGAVPETEITHSEPLETMPSTEVLRPLVAEAVPDTEFAQSEPLNDPQIYLPESEVAASDETKQDAENLNASMDQKSQQSAPTLEPEAEGDQKQWSQGDSDFDQGESKGADLPANQAGAQTSDAQESSVPPLRSDSSVSEVQERAEEEKTGSDSFIRQQPVLPPPPLSKSTVEAANTEELAGSRPVLRKPTKIDSKLTSLFSFEQIWLCYLCLCSTP